MASRYLSGRPELGGQVCLFAAVEELLRGGKLADICCVNVEAEYHLEAGGQVKSKYPRTALVFYGKQQRSDWAMEAYRQRALQYLPLPVEESLFEETLDRAVREEDLCRVRRVVLNSTQGLVNLQVPEIAYAKSCGHRVTFFLADGRRFESKCLRVSFSEVIKPLLDSGFLRCHDSYAVNLRRVSRLTTEGAQLSDGAVVPVSTKKRAWVREILKHCLLL